MLRGLVQAAQAEAGADEQRDRQRHLRRHQRAAQADDGRSARPAEPESRSVVATSAGAAWAAGASANSSTVPIAMAAVNHTHASHRRLTPDESAAPTAAQIRSAGRTSICSATRAAAAPSAGEDDAFDEQLLHDAPAAGAHRQSDRDLALPRRGARQQQAGEVRARDQQHHAGDRGQDQQHRPQHAMPPSGELSSGNTAAR